MADNGTLEALAKDAIVTLIDDFASGQKRAGGLMGSPQREAAYIETSLDRAIQALMTAARKPIEERLRAQEQQIRDLKEAVERLQTR